MSSYYNEIDPYAAQWLRNLIAAGHIAPGDVDERSITDVRPDDLAGYTQCHFFAGIGGWSYALRLAGWPDDRPVWTGSCPCQPFSAAGKGEGFNDDRHLWPAFFRLIRECRPDSVFGEQVASNLAWLDLVSGDLEGEGYAVGSAILGAHSIGAPHIRQRLYWVADAGSERRQQVARSAPRDEGAHGRRAEGNHEPSGDGEDGRGMADDTSSRRREERALAGGQPAREREEGRAAGLAVSGGGGTTDWLADADDAGLEGRGLQGRERAGELAPWEASVLIPCADGRWRPVPVEPGVQPLAHGVPGRVGRLRAYGNAIVPQVAAAFVMACQP